MEANIITSSSAYSGGLISEDGGGEISSRGVCWNTSPNPTIEDSKNLKMVLKLEVLTAFT